MQPVYKPLTSDVLLLEDTGDTFLLSTDGAPHSIAGLLGDGYQDGTEVKFMNNGPDSVTLKHNDPAVPAGSRFFLPGGVDRVLGPTGAPYWMVRNDDGPLGDGWYNGEDPP